MVFSLDGLVPTSISCVEMHTSGEPTRIILSGFPELTGTLMEQRAQAKQNLDQYRRFLMLEPRGHRDMYGAILRPETELVKTGEADFGVLFMHNEGFSTMCGHATIALGRFLVDCDDEQIFSRRRMLKYDAETQTTFIKLHVPCGVVDVSVPTLASGKSDPSRPVSFISVPSFATGISVTVHLPEQNRWPELGGRDSITADFCYGGAFYCVISSTELGFPQGLSEDYIQRLSHATALLKKTVNENPDLSHLTRHIQTAEPGVLYSVLIVDDTKRNKDPSSSETGLCFFANQQIDRSPTGGSVAARISLAYTKGDLSIGERCTFDSLFTGSDKGLAGFVGSAVEELKKEGETESSRKNICVRVKVEGYANYMGYSTWVAEKADGLGVNGFLL
jgi:trans-L-3-hydroxyproline dehydratase